MKQKKAIPNKSSINNPIVQNEKLIIFGILFLTFLVYIPILNNEFTYFSDDNYILYNSLIKELSFSRIIYIFSSYFDGHYHPLTLLSFSFSYALGKINPFIYLFTNLLLHLINTYLVFKLIKHLIKDIKIVIIVTLLFGIHTLHVESVARITERKDVLYTFFFLLSLIQYLKYYSENKIKYYYLSLLFFLLSLFSKGQAVSLAVSLFLIDYFLGKKIFNLKSLFEKIPFLILALIFGILNIYAQRYTGYFPDTASMPFYEPFVDSCFVLTNYIIKLFVPVNLSALYPYPNQPGMPMPLFMWFFIIPMSALLITLIYFIKKSKIITFGILFYLINILLMARIIPVAENIMPDRYNYVASIGFFIIIGVIYKNIHDKFLIYRKKLIYFSAIYISLLSILTFSRCNVWNSGLSVWQDASEKYPQSSIIWKNIGDNYVRKNDFPNAIQAFNNAVKFDSANLLAYFARSELKRSIGDFKGANIDYRTAASMASGNSDSYANRANAKLFLNDFSGAEADYLKAIELNPFNIKLYLNLGNFYYLIMDYKNSILYYSIAISMRTPNPDMAYWSLGKTYSANGNYDLALENFNLALQYTSDDKFINKNINQVAFLKQNFRQNESFVTAKEFNIKGTSFFNEELYIQAISYFDRAIALDSAYAGAYRNRGLCYYQLWYYKKAKIDLIKAAKLGAKFEKDLLNQISVFVQN